LKQWTEAGDAFRISDLNRLENETLPTYFRHRRFQSLVRQLNFYNFRKVNRERNFWVYKHPLFQFERPQDLHLLRRRTCPGVDGRKVRPDAEHGGQGYEPKSIFSLDAVLSSKSAIAISPHESSDSDEGNTIAITATISKKRKKSSRKKSDASLSSSSEDEHPPKTTKTSFMVGNHLTVPDKKLRTEPVHALGLLRLVSPLAKSASSQLDMNEQSVLVSKVSKQLDEHAKKAAAIMGKHVMKTRTNDITPTYVSSTMRYNALTYDDEVEIFDSTRGCVVEKNYVSSKDNDASDDGSENSATVVSFSDYEVQEASTRIISAPISDSNIIFEVRKKLRDVNNNISHLTTAIAEFCMTTDPHDPFLCEKAIQLMSNHAELAQEFCRYKIALSPNNFDHSGFMRALFSGQSKETVRGFKTFVLNSLKDLVRETKSWNEFDALSKCYNVWFSGVSLSAQA
jgi:hypothetical protein